MAPQYFPKLVYLKFNENRVFMHTDGQMDGAILISLCRAANGDIKKRKD
jgi:hypothetical protein